MSKELCLHKRRRSYSTFKVRKGDLVQGKEQQLRFAGAAVKRYPTSKVRGRSREELPRIRGQGRQLRGAMRCLRSGAVAKSARL